MIKAASRKYQGLVRWIRRTGLFGFAIKLKKRPHYALGDLLAECDETAPYPNELEDWEKAPVVGREHF